MSKMIYSLDRFCSDVSVMKMRKNKNVLNDYTAHLNWHPRMFTVTSHQQLPLDTKSIGSAGVVISVSCVSYHEYFIL